MACSHHYHGWDSSLFMEIEGGEVWVDDDITHDKSLQTSPSILHSG